MKNHATCGNIENKNMDLAVHKPAGMAIVIVKQYATNMDIQRIFTDLYDHDVICNDQGPAH